MMKHETTAFGHTVCHAGQKDGAAIITHLMDTIQKTAAQIIDVIETRLLGERSESVETEEAPGMLPALSDDRALVGA